MRVLEIFGDSADLGAAHGSTCSEEIRRYLEKRLDLAAQENWSGSTPGREVILEVAESTLEHHQRFSERLYAEMMAMAEAAGITPAEAVVVGGFTDLVDAVRGAVGEAPAEHNCTAVLNPAKGFLAQTWDMHASAGEFVVLLKLDPLMGPNALVQTTAGCLGQIGMNEAGISIGINNLTSIGKPGVTWPFVVRKVLNETDFDSAVDIVVNADLAGGHNFLLMGPDGEAVNIEAMPNECHVTGVSGLPFVHTNHCLHDETARGEGWRLPEHVDGSNERLEIASGLTEEPEALFAHPAISREVEDIAETGTCGAVIIEPDLKRMRTVWGIPGQHPWETFQL